MKQKDIKEIIDTIKWQINRTKMELMEAIQNNNLIKFNEAQSLYKEVVKNINSIKQIKKELENKYKENEELVKRYYLIPREEIIPVEEQQELDKKMEAIKIAEQQIEEELKPSIKEIEKLIEEFKVKNKEMEYDETESRKQKVREIILRPESKPEYVILQRRTPKQSDYFGDCEGYTIRKILVPKKMQELIELGAYGLKTNFMFHDGDHYPTFYYEEITFRTYEDATLEEKQALREAELKVKRIKESPTDYEQKEKGTILVPLYDLHPQKTRHDQLHGKTSEVIAYAHIEATPRELAESGIVYTDLDWKSAKENAISLGSLSDAIKSFFGKGERYIW